MWECNELIHIKSLKQGPKRVLNKCQLLITLSPSFSCVFLPLSLCLYSWASPSLLKSDSAFKVQPLIDHRSQPVRRGGAIWIIESKPLILQMKSRRHREAHSVAQGHSASLRQTWPQTLPPGLSFRCWAASMWGAPTVSCAFVTLVLVL